MSAHLQPGASAWYIDGTSSTWLIPQRVRIAEEYQQLPDRYGLRMVSYLEWGVSSFVRSECLFPSEDAALRELALHVLAK